MAETEVGIVLVTHGTYGEPLLEAARGIVGPLAGFLSIAIGPRDQQKDVAHKIDQALHAADRGAGVLLCADLCGSTPGNACLAVASAAEVHGERAAVVFGLSLAMLMKLAASDRTGATPAELAVLCAETARKSVRVGEGR